MFLNGIAGRGLKSGRRLSSVDAAALSPWQRGALAARAAEVAPRGGGRRAGAGDRVRRLAVRPLLGPRRAVRRPRRRPPAVAALRHGAGPGGRQARRPRRHGARARAPRLPRGGKRRAAAGRLPAHRRRARRLPARLPDAAGVGGRPQPGGAGARRHRASATCRRQERAAGAARAAAGHLVLYRRGQGAAAGTPRRRFPRSWCSASSPPRTRASSSTAESRCAASPALPTST